MFFFSAVITGPEPVTPTTISKVLFLVDLMPRTFSRESPALHTRAGQLHRSLNACVKGVVWQSKTFPLQPRQESSGRVKASRSCLLISKISLQRREKKGAETRRPPPGVAVLMSWGQRELLMDSNSSGQNPFRRSSTEIKHGLDLVRTSPWL